MSLLRKSLSLLITLGCFLQTIQLSATDKNCTPPELLDDEAALRYCQLKGDVYIAILFPCVQDKSIDYEIIKKIFNKFGCIMYTKNTELTALGALNLIRIAYEGEPWIGSNKSTQLSFLKRFVNKSKTGLYRIKAILFECKNLKTVVKCKSTIRKIFNCGLRSIHINDTHQETLTLARTLFCKNSVDFINRAQLKNFVNFDKCITYYENFLTEKIFNRECYC